MIENLFFAIFGQKESEAFTINQGQPEWTKYFFKTSFLLYMMVTVIVLINLLIAMMSDTYQKITAQSDLEWKYGLSKLIRSMQKTSTAPSPLNLVSAWSFYLWGVFKKRMARRQNTRRNAPRFLGRYFGRWMTPYQEANVMPLHKDNIDLGMMHGETASQLSFEQRPTILNVVDWDIVRRKYRVLFGGEIEKPSSEDMDELDDN